MQAYSLRRLFVILSLCTSPFLLIAGERRFHVSPRGDDSNSGGEASPFLTIPRARDAVRQFRMESPRHRGAVRIVLHGGRYGITEPILLGPEDGGRATSPVIYSAAKGEMPVISGGIEVRGWQPRLVNGKRLWAASLPVPPGGKVPSIRQIWINGSRRTAARHPNQGYLKVAAVPDLRPETAWNEGQRAFRYAPGEIPAGAEADGGEGIVMTLWTEAHLPLIAVRPDSMLLRFGHRTVYRLAPGDLYYLLNVRAALDEPGEFYHDAAAQEILYLPRPGEEIERATVVVPYTPQLLLIKGKPDEKTFVEHLRFEGITFSHTNWHFQDHAPADSALYVRGGFGQAAVGLPAAVQADGLRHSMFYRCTVTEGGTYGIAFRGGCAEDTVEQCRITSLGGGGVMIGTTSIAPSPERRTEKILVANSELADLGLLYHSAVGVWIGQSPRNRIFHNEIRDLYYSGISIGWTWGYGPSDAAGNLVEWNHVHHVGKRSDGDGPILADMGGIYTLGGQPGTLIRRNYFHDIAARQYGGWGIYYDEGSTRITSEENLVVRTFHEGFHQHYGKENIFRNNIIAFGEGYQVRRDHEEPHTSFAFERNIVLWNAGPMFTWEDLGWSMVFDRNIYWRTDGRGMMTDSMEFAEWQRTASDHRSRFADPRFLDAMHDDFRLHPGSPALAIGFREFSVARAVERRPMPLSEIPTPRRPLRRLIYNNDGSSIPMSADTLTPQLAFRRVDPLAGSGVTTFLYNVNPGQNMGYPSRVADMYRWENPPPESSAAWNIYGIRMSNNLKRLTAQGVDPVEMVLDRSRLRGMETFVTFRMNELHDVDKPESPLLGRFWKEHPAYRVGGYEGWGASALNYGVPEVREYFFALLAEVVDRYEMEGLELDFMRFPYYFPFRADSMTAYSRMMTSFMERVRRLTDSTGVARGRRILLAARVPSSLSGCAHVGLDPAAWTSRGLIDLLVVAPFLSTEMDIPIGEFKRACPGVPIYPCIEFTIGARQMTREEKRGAAARLYAAGADGIYLFNYFVAWDAGLQADVDVLSELTHPDSLLGKPKVYTLAVPRYPVPGVSLPGQVPISIGAGKSAAVTIKTVEPKPLKELRLRIECDEDVSSGEIALRFNGADPGAGWTPAEPQFFPQPVWPDLPARGKILEFRADPRLIATANRLLVTARKPVTVRSISLAAIP